jgi:hypothetical protein
MRYNPIPFDNQLLQSALEMKRSGLPWTPEKGCFVWDPQGVIQAPSPFPNRVYFILNMRRFLDIFGSIEAMQEKLVWLPTWYQAVQLSSELEVRWAADEGSLTSEATWLVRLYQQIARKLRRSKLRYGYGSISLKSDEDSRWLDEVIESELGSLDDLPGEVQRWIRSTYDDVASAYLGWRRIQEGKADQWLPAERSFDPGLLSELGHFFSDYQHQIRTLRTVRQTVQLYRTVDSEADPTNRNQLLQVLIDAAGKKHEPDGVLEQLMTPIEHHAISR